MIKYHNRELLVAKFGSSTLVDRDSGKLSQEKINNYAEGLAAVGDQFNLIVVSSGAVAVGASMLKADEHMDQAVVASMGSAGVVCAWQSAFGNHDIRAGQLPVTHKEIDDEVEGVRLDSFLACAVIAGVVTVINENDALSVEELRKLHYGGDNDGLAAHIAKRVSADKLVLFTDRNFTDNEGSVVSEFHSEDRHRVEAFVYSADGAGRGGMTSKINAGCFAAQQGVQTHIAAAGSGIIEVLSGEVGTHIRASEQNIVD